jgi:23S rRNA (guanosine2251-2'-O)-methyltransferase
MHLMSKQKQKTNHHKLERPQSLDTAPVHLWIYGIHASIAALKNPNRRINTILTTKHSSDFVTELNNSGLPPHQITDRNQLDSILPLDSVHQGIAVQCDPLPLQNLEDVISNQSKNSALIILDQANDPRNIGSVLRSAAAFDATAVIVPDRGTPLISGSMAKAAAGAIEQVPFVRVKNLARSLRIIKNAGYWCVGLDSRATQTLAEAKLSGRIAIVMGAEGRGLRQLTAETCDYLAKIPISGQMESLNLSIATSIALYELNRTSST